MLKLGNDFYNVGNDPWVSRIQSARLEVLSDTGSPWDHERISIFRLGNHCESAQLLSG